VNENRSFQLNDGNKALRIPVKKRLIIGSGDTADIQLRKGNVEPIHCLLENVNNDWKLYNLAPSSVVKVNGENVVATSLKEGDQISIGSRTFVFEVAAAKKLPSSSLPPVAPPAPMMQEPQVVTENFNKPLPTMPVRVLNKEAEVSYDENHPLEADPEFMFSEYIFEDQDEIFPIFKYTVGKKAAEVVILFKNKVLSVDYLSLENGRYHLAGVAKKIHDIDFPYLGKDEKLPIVDIKGSEVFLHKIPGFEHKKFSDDKSDSMVLGGDDIHLFENGDLRIFVRGDEAPPFVKSAPILRRDTEFKKYLILCLLFVIAFVSFMSMFEVDPELEKEKVPERIATILYKPKTLRVSKQNEVVKEIVKKKEVVKKTPEKPKVAVKETAQKEVKSKGDITAKNNNANTPKKGNPVKGPKNNITKVTKTTKSAGKPGKSTAKTTTKTNVANKNYKGNVDTYKSADFSSSISSLMAKGGSLSSTTNTGGAAVSFQDNNAIASNSSAQIEKANVDASVGSLTSRTKGTLESSYGTDGLVQKKQVYIAGVPYKEVILGSIDRNDIYRILLENAPQFQYCQQKELDVRQAAVEGVLVLNFVIGPSGHVTKASASSKGTSLPKSTRDCVVNHLKTIQFPKPKGGGEVAVNTPLNIQAKQM